MKSIKSILAALVLAVLAPNLFAHADPVGTYGDVSVVTGSNGSPAWQLTSDPKGAGYGGIYLTFNGSLTPAMLTQLSADYQMVAGTIGGGAPRFSIIDTTNNASNEAYVYFGTPAGGGTFSDPNSGGYGNTGNYANLLSPDIRVQVNGFGGDSTGSGYETWNQFVTKDGATQIGYITIDVDGGFTSTQAADIENFDVNGNTYNPAGNVAATPGPASLMLLGTGMLGLGGEMFRRRKYGDPTHQRL